MSAADLIQAYLPLCNIIIDSFRDTLFTLSATKENMVLNDSYRKDTASSGFTLVNTSVKLKGLKAGQDISI